MRTIALTINGKGVTASVDPRTHLADFLREQQHLTGTHLGCEHGVCGACTLLIDGEPARSCITYAVACDGARITTIEGLDDDEIAGELRGAFSREHALQCGFCTPGMLIAGRDLIARAVRPSDREIRVAMSGNLCRCTGYVGIVRAIDAVITDRRGRGIVAIPGNGRTDLGPVGAGHAMATLQADTVSKPIPVVQKALAEPLAPTRLTDFQPQVTFQRSFTVSYPREVVWDFFGRTADVAACLPGASVTGDAGAAHVTGKMRVKVGPISADFGGSAEIERDAQSHAGIIRGSGRDARSSSATRGIIRYRLQADETPETTRVDLDIGYTLTGPLAQFSRSDLMQDITTRLIDTFVRNLEARLAAPDDAPPRQATELNAAGLMWSVLLARLRRWFTPRR